MAFEISTHALREEGDGIVLTYNKTIPNFYPRPPRGGRPLLFNIRFFAKIISTHALREEGDAHHPHLRAVGQRISTHALREEGDRLSSLSVFSSFTISTHALREEGDPKPLKL